MKEIQDKQNREKEDSDTKLVQKKQDFDEKVTAKLDKCKDDLDNMVKYFEKMFVNMSKKVSTLIVPDGNTTVKTKGIDEVKAIKYNFQFCIPAKNTTNNITKYSTDRFAIDSKVLQANSFKKKLIEKGRKFSWR